jgi:hypothetical protein
MNLTGHKLGFVSRGGIEGLFKIRSNLYSKVAEIRGEFEYGLFFCIQVAENKIASRSQGVEPSIADFILKSLKISCSSQW